MTERYWIAINGASCALCRIPFENPATVPRAELLIGFLTVKEAENAQRICLTLPIARVAAFINGLGPDIDAGHVVARRNDNPDPPTHGQTMWLNADDPMTDEIIKATREVQ